MVTTQAQGFEEAFSTTFDTCVLDNGLTLIVHENRTSPQVALNLWYRVGSKDEGPGQTGFAHLFEHLMFGGSRNLPGSFLNHLIEAGATDLNGTTSHDRTNYYATVPTAALDFVLFAESDRMGCFIDTVSQATLDLQRNVVLNEKRQTESVPYGGIHERQLRATYPQGHPYAHTVLGAEEDLLNARLEDVHAWFRRYYTPSNAVLTLAGDIDMATAKAKVELYFGWIASGPPLSRPAIQVPPIVPGTREVLEDRVAHGCVRLIWNIPPYGNAHHTRLGLLADLLANGLSSRLHQRLVVQRPLAVETSADISSGMLASQFIVTAIARPEVSLADLEQAIQDEIGLLVTQGIAVDDLQRVKMAQWAGFLNQHETMAAIAELFSSSQVLLGRPDGFHQVLAQRGSATAESIRATALQWLNEQCYTLWVVPFTCNVAERQGMALRPVPAIRRDAWSAPSLEVHRKRLNNGLQVLLNPRAGLPVVNLLLRVDAGAAVEPAARAGLARLTRRLMLEGGAGARDGEALTAAFQQIGASISLGGNQDCSWIRLRTLRSNLAEAVDLLGDLLLHPRLPEAVFERIRASMLDELAQEATSAPALVQRLAPGLLYPEGHPYARPAFNQCTQASLQAVRVAEVQDFYQRYIGPERTSLVVTGDVSLAEVLDCIQPRFAQWHPCRSPQRPIPCEFSPRPGLFVVDRPGAVQATLFAGSLIQIALAEFAPFAVLNEILGNGFGSRLNMRLREENAWTYGVGSLLSDGIGPKLWGVQATVDDARTSDAMLEIRQIYRDVLAQRPFTAQEVEKSRESMLLGLAGMTDCLDRLSGSIEHLLKYRLPDDYWQGYCQQLADLHVDEVQHLARQIVQPEQLTWIVVGDLQRIGAALNALDWGPMGRITDLGESLYPSHY